MNLVMDTLVRPTVLFDPTDSEHRAWALAFLETRSWNGCPVMFALPKSEPNVYTMITRELSLYYLQKEFRSACPVVKIQQKYLVKNG